MSTNIDQKVAHVRRRNKLQAIKIAIKEAELQWAEADAWHQFYVRCLGSKVEIRNIVNKIVSSENSAATWLQRKNRLYELLHETEIEAQG